MTDKKNNKRELIKKKEILVSINNTSLILKVTIKVCNFRFKKLKAKTKNKAIRRNLRNSYKMTLLNVLNE